MGKDHSRAEKALPLWRRIRWDRHGAGNILTQAVWVKLNHPGFPGGSIILEDGAMDRRTRYSLKVRERAVRLVFEHEGGYSAQWSAIVLIAEKFGVHAGNFTPMGASSRDGRGSSLWPDHGRT